jgi:hypothetical protein
MAGAVNDIHINNKMQIAELLLHAFSKRQSQQNEAESQKGRQTKLKLRAKINSTLTTKGRS